MLPPPDLTVRIAGTEILNDNRREALEELIEACREDGLDGEISYRPPTGRGISIWEVTAIYLGGKLLDAATGQLMKSAVENIIKRSTVWARERLRRGDSPRPQTITIYGPNGEVIKEVSVEPRDVDPNTTSRFQEIIDKARREEEEQQRRRKEGPQ
jgi:hypothetical protein